MSEPRVLVFFAWNAQAELPLSGLIVDEAPCFQVALFDYSGSRDQSLELVSVRVGSRLTLACMTVSQATEGKGQVLWNIAKLLVDEARGLDYVGVIDDDVLVRVSDLNRAISLGSEHGLVTFQPSLARCSHVAHDFTLHQPGSSVRLVNWVEIMMPLIKADLFIKAADFFAASISSWGLDCYALPMLAITEGFGHRHGIIDASLACHTRPLRSNAKTFSNGLTAQQELQRIKAMCLAHLNAEAHAFRQHPQLSDLLALEI